MMQLLENLLANKKTLCLQTVIVRRHSGIVLISDHCGTSEDFRRETGIFHSKVIVEFESYVLLCLIL